MTASALVVGLCITATTAQLLFPPSAPSRIQMIAGIGVPFETGEAVSVISGWGLKTQHLLPINTTDLHPVFFPGIFGDNGIGPQFTFGRRRRDIDEDHTHFDDGGAAYRYDEDEDMSAEEVVVSNYDTDDLRWVMYRTFEAFVRRKGYESKACLLRTICEAAESPFTPANGLLGELLHILLTPSSTAEPLSQHADNEYLHAEQAGKSGQPCAQVFAECTQSILQTFSGVYDPIVEFLDFS